jgi:hypothetical protein
MTAPNPSTFATELCDSVAFSAGAGYARRTIAEQLRQRAGHIEVLQEAFPSNHGYRRTATELRRLADQIEAAQ